MTLENQVTSLKLSKRLKELGVKQESLFYWEWQEGNDYDGWNLQYPLDGDVAADNKRYLSAFTVAELGEMLPSIVDGKFFQYDKSDLTHRIGYYLAELFWTQVADTEADARAKMLCYLLENKLTN